MVVATGASLFPAFVPLLGLPALLRYQWSWQPVDVLFALAALLVTAPLVMAGAYGHSLAELLQYLAIWLIYRSFAAIARSRSEPSGGFVAGLNLGLLLTAAVGYLQVGGGLARAIGFTPHANLYGQSLFVVASLIAISLPQGNSRLAPLALGGIGILLSGSRTGALGWVGICLFLGIRHLLCERITLPHLLRLTALVVVVGATGASLGWGRFASLMESFVPGPSANLIRGSELPTASWWFPEGVTVETHRANVNEQELLAYSLTKLGSEPWQRLQQSVRLEPGSVYTVSVYLQDAKSETRPGLQGWGRAEGKQSAFIVTAALTEEQLHANISGSGTILAAETVRQDAWTRIWVTFVYEGDTPVTSWMVGPAPDQRNIAGTSATFAGMQLEQSDSPSAYEPTYWTGSSDMRQSGAARVPYWEAAWKGFLSRPVAGWGDKRFEVYYRNNLPPRGSAGDIPTHTHNLFLQYAFERGLLGLLGLLLLCLALAYKAIARKDTHLLVILGALITMNFVDYTLFYAGIVYPLAAVTGWRSARE